MMRLCLVDIRASELVPRLGLFYNNGNYYSFSNNIQNAL